MIRATKEAPKPDAPDTPPPTERERELNQRREQFRQFKKQETGVLLTYLDRISRVLEETNQVSQHIPEKTRSDIAKTAADITKEVNGVLAKSYSTIHKTLSNKEAAALDRRIDIFVKISRALGIAYEPIEEMKARMERELLEEPPEEEVEDAADEEQDPEQDREEEQEAEKEAEKENEKTILDQKLEAVWQAFPSIKDDTYKKKLKKAKQLAKNLDLSDSKARKKLIKAIAKANEALPGSAAEYEWVKRSIAMEKLAEYFKINKSKLNELFKEAETEPDTPDDTTADTTSPDSAPDATPDTAFDRNSVVIEHPLLREIFQSFPDAPGEEYSEQLATLSRYFTRLTPDNEVKINELLRAIEQTEAAIPDRSRDSNANRRTVLKDQLKKLLDVPAPTTAPSPDAPPSPDQPSSTDTSSEPIFDRSKVELDNPLYKDILATFPEAPGEKYTVWLNELVDSFSYIDPTDSDSTPLILSQIKILERLIPAGVQDTNKSRRDELVEKLKALATEPTPPPAPKPEPTIEVPKRAPELEGFNHGTYANHVRKIKETGRAYNADFDEAAKMLDMATNEPGKHLGSHNDYEAFIGEIDTTLESLTASPRKMLENIRTHKNDRDSMYSNQLFQRKQPLLEAYLKACDDFKKFLDSYLEPDSPSPDEPTPAAPSSRPLDAPSTPDTPPPTPSAPSTPSTPRPPLTPPSRPPAPNRAPIDDLDTALKIDQDPPDLEPKDTALERISNFDERTFQQLLTGFDQQLKSALGSNEVYQEFVLDLAVDLQFNSVSDYQDFANRIVASGEKAISQSPNLSLRTKAALFASLTRLQSFLESYLKPAEPQADRPSLLGTEKVYLPGEIADEEATSDPVADDVGLSADLDAVTGVEPTIPATSKKKYKKVVPRRKLTPEQKEQLTREKEQANSFIDRQANTAKESLADELSSKKDKELLTKEIDRLTKSSHERINRLQTDQNIAFVKKEFTDLLIDIVKGWKESIDEDKKKVTDKAETLKKQAEYKKAIDELKDLFEQNVAQRTMERYAKKNFDEVNADEILNKVMGYIEKNSSLKIKDYFSGTGISGNRIAPNTEASKYLPPLQRLAKVLGRDLKTFDYKPSKRTPKKES